LLVDEEVGEEEASSNDRCLELMLFYDTNVFFYLLRFRPELRGGSL